MNEGSIGKKRIDNLLTVAIVIVSVVTGYFLGKNSNAPSPPKSSPARAAASTSPADLIGTSILLQNEEWDKNKRTLVMALQTGCHFCSESGSFYKRLAEERSHFGDTRLVAVLPQSQDESKRYLDKLGFSVDDIRQQSLGSLGVSGTPTLMLVNASGVVTDAWQGKLKPEMEQVVLDRLRVK